MHAPMKEMLALLLALALLFSYAGPVGVAGARPSDYPDVMSYVNTTILSNGYMADLTTIFFDAIAANSNKNQIYDHLLGYMYWSNIRSNQNLDILTNESKLRNDSINTINVTADQIPSLLGPGNATTGHSYLVNHTLRANKTEMNTTLGKTLDAFSSRFKVLSEMYVRLPEVFGNFNPGSIW